MASLGSPARGPEAMRFPSGANTNTSANRGSTGSLNHSWTRAGISLTVLAGTGKALTRYAWAEAVPGNMRPNIKTKPASHPGRPMHRLSPATLLASRPFSMMTILISKNEKQ